MDTNPSAPRTEHDIAREELHVDIMGANLFRTTMIYAVGFCAVCFYIIMQ